MEYEPDRWVIIEGVWFNGEPTRRVLAGWSGGYLYDDEWRMSSGITNITEYDDRYEIDNHSGSHYICYKNRRGLTSLSAAALKSYQEKYPELKLTIVENQN